MSTKVLIFSLIFRTDQVRPVTKQWPRYQLQRTMQQVEILPLHWAANFSNVEMLQLVFGKLAFLLYDVVRAGVTNRYL